MEIPKCDTVLVVRRAHRFQQQKPGGVWREGCGPIDAEFFLSARAMQDASLRFVADACRCFFTVLLRGFARRMPSLADNRARVRHLLPVTIAEFSELARCVRSFDDGVPALADLLVLKDAKRRGG
jgi:hypothetical protein